MMIYLKGRIPSSPPFHAGNLGLTSRYEAAFIAKLNDSKGEAAETQTWLDFAVEGKYLEPEVGQELSGIYDEIIAILVKIINNPEPWLIKRI